jgi:two-component system chemotaxis sensor kinase CheA
MDEELLRDFVNECRDHLTTIEADLLRIEEGGANIDEVLVNKVFRAAHSIKGGSGFFELKRIKELAHSAETVLDLLRSRKMPPNAEVTNVLLAAFDRLRDMVNHLETSEGVEIQDLVDGLAALSSSYVGSARKQEPVAPAAAPPITPAAADLDRARKNGMWIYRVECDLVHDVEEAGTGVQEFFQQLGQACEVLECRVDEAAVGTLEGHLGGRLPLQLAFSTRMDPDHVGTVFETLSRQHVTVLLDPRVAVAAPPPEPAAVAVPVRVEVAPQDVAPAPDRHAPEVEAHATPPEDSLRVHVGLLETLMNLAGELVLSRNQLRAAVAQDNRQLLASADQRINQVTSELQDVIMQTRLQPLGNVFAKFPRLVRDLSRSLGKDIQLDVEGKDVALDKSMVEGLSDPLIHMVRNAVDHGIETPAERLAAGKKAVGTVRINARHEAGQVVVEISDDGKGIDPQKLVEVAVRKGILSPEKALGMSDRDKQALIFMPGFTTAQKVTDVSGRGVGMDVVKTNLDRLGGQVEILSTPGKGSTFRIKLPLTLAIIPSLIISVEDERFAIPQANIEELIQLRPEDLKNRIEGVGDCEVLLLRDRLLPLARFADILGAVPTYVDKATGQREVDRRGRLADRRSPRRSLDPNAPPPPQPSKEVLAQRRKGDRRQASSSALEIAVVTTGTMSYGLVVGSLHDTEEVVVKPLGRRLKQLREYSGATILGDGTVALILDVAGLAAKAGLTSVSGSGRAAELAALADAQRLEDLQSLLLFQNGPGEPCAVPLDLVQRIERIQPSQVERLGSNRTMQYRGGSLPLVTLSDVATVGTPEDQKELVVLVSSCHGHQVGLLAAMPVDVIESRAVVDQSTHKQKGVAGSTIIQGKTTLVVDLHELVDTVHPAWGAARSEIRENTHAVTGGAPTVLLAEDSDFFRAQVKKYLEEDGFKVLAAPDGQAAWELLLKNVDKVRVVVTDIEMPNLTGLGLAARIRADARTARLPIIAVTSLASEEDTARGLAAGVNEYQVKLDRDMLLASVHARASAVENIQPTAERA